jgi:hypothetical protein
LAEGLAFAALLHGAFWAINTVTVVKVVLRGVADLVAVAITSVSFSADWLALRAYLHEAFSANHTVVVVEAELRFIANFLAHSVSNHAWLADVHARAIPSRRASIILRQFIFKVHYPDLAFRAGIAVTIVEVEFSSIASTVAPVITDPVPWTEEHADAILLAGVVWASIAVAIIESETGSIAFRVAGAIANIQGVAVWHALAINLCSVFRTGFAVAIVEIGRFVIAFGIANVVAELFRRAGIDASNSFLDLSFVAGQAVSTV